MQVKNREIEKKLVFSCLEVHEYSNFSLFVVVQVLGSTMPGPTVWS